MEAKKGGMQSGGRERSTVPVKPSPASAAMRLEQYSGGQTWHDAPPAALPLQTCSVASSSPGANQWLPWGGR